MNDVKLHAKNKRMSILKAIDDIEATVCKSCPVSKLRTYEKAGKHLCKGCDHFAKINALGEDMIAVTNASRSVPDVLNKSAYELLKDRDWTDKEIQKHYGISNNDFDFFLSQNQLHSRKNQKSRIHFDVNAYTEWIMQGKTDVAFSEHYGINIHTLKLHKTKFGVKTADIPKPPKPPKPQRVRKKPKKAHIDAQPIQSKSEGTQVAKITVDVYESHRERKMKDKDIAKFHNMSMPSLYQFKSKNGLSNKRKLADPAPVEPTAEDKAFIEAYENKELDLEPIALVELVEPAKMPSIESDWKPAEAVVNLAELAEKVSVDQETPLPNPVIIQQQYEIDKWKREAELWKFRQKETEQKFFDLSGDYRELEVEFTNFKAYCQTIEKENGELKETVILNHLLMKQSVRFLDRLDAMLENPKEASEFVWR